VIRAYLLGFFSGTSAAATLAARATQTERVQDAANQGEAGKNNSRQGNGSQGLISIKMAH
jgi:hypothetical protein